jgi:uncharacterized protein YbjT (DUF2867 family)
MRVVLYGASGMVGGGALRACLQDKSVTEVLAIGRSRVQNSAPKLRQLVLPDLCNYAKVSEQLKGYDACFYCLGVSALGMSEEAYQKVTYDFTMAAAQALLKQSPAMTFVFVSGSGADSSEGGRVMWARIKGKTENALLKMPFRKVHVLRPGMIQPVHGATSRTTSYRIIYVMMAPLMPLLRSLMPRKITTTDVVGQAMLKLAKDGSQQKLLTNADINALVA